MMAKRRKIKIKNAREIESMRVAGRVASTVLQETVAAVRPGMTTGDIDAEVARLIAREGAKSAFHGYRGFLGQACISLNEEVVHGIGGARVVQPGDILKIDVGVVKNGWIGDNATTFGVGELPVETRRLLNATEEALYRAIERARSGARLAEVCAAVEEHAKASGLSVVREFVGHGVGRDLHEEPQVPNYRPEGKTPLLQPGMILAIEPMINLGGPQVKILSDGWTVVTADRQPSAHFEHTVLITEGEAEILTDRPRLATAGLLGL